MIAIEGKNICKSFNGLEVLRDVSLSLKTGEFLALLGPSGCGKTTLLSILAGLIPFNGGELVQNSRPSIMMQKDLLLPWKKTIDNICLPLRLKGIKKLKAREKAAAHVTAFGLSGFEYRYPGELSGGMRQRAALLRTWLSDGDVMLLDEPFGSLDSLTRRTMQAWLSEVRVRYGMTILMVTHDVEEAVALADRILVLSPRPARVIEDTPVEKGGDQEKTKRKVLDILLSF